MSNFNTELSVTSCKHLLTSLAVCLEGGHYSFECDVRKASRIFHCNPLNKEDARRMLSVLYLLPSGREEKFSSLPLVSVERPSLLSLIYSDGLVALRKGIIVDNHRTSQVFFNPPSEEE